MYNLRQREGYQRQRQVWTKTRPVTVPIGERRAPAPSNQPGYLRVDSVHQGDQDGLKRSSETVVASPRISCFNSQRQRSKRWSQTVTTFTKLKFSPTLPYAFTEHGALMASNVLNSPRAAEVSIFVVRAFVQLRDLLATHKTLAKQLSEVEKRVGGHDKDIAAIIVAIRKLLSPPPEPPRRKMGF